MGNFIDQACEQIRRRSATRSVILGLSGGVDSSVGGRFCTKPSAINSPAFLSTTACCARKKRKWCREFSAKISLQAAIRGRLEDFLVDTQGRDRSRAQTQDHRQQLHPSFRQRLDQLADATRPSKAAIERSIFRARHALSRRDRVRPIAGNPAAVIKSHHNVGGLPKKMKFKLVEPLRNSSRTKCGSSACELGLPREIVFRQPFPGPGLAVRILGEVTPSGCDPARGRHDRGRSEMKASDWYYKVWQSFAVLLPVRAWGSWATNAPTITPSPSASWNPRTA